MRYITNNKEAMNLLRNTIKIVLILSVFFTSCDRLLYDDLSECEQGVYVSFYTKTPCVLDSSFVGNVSSLHIFAFDENDLLVTTQELQNVTLDKEFKTLIPLNQGDYSFIAWTNLAPRSFQVNPFINGKTSKKDVLFSLKVEQDRAFNLSDKKIGQGESKKVHIPNAEKYGSIYKDVAINLREVTNRVTIQVEIDESIKNTIPQDFLIDVRSANGTMLIDGSMPLNNAILNYPGTTTYTQRTITTKFTTLDLALGYNNELVITNRNTEEIVYRGDLIGSILLNTIGSNINLACDNDFYINLKLRDKCADCGTYYACDIFVNGWEVHSYDIEFE